MMGHRLAKILENLCANYQQHVYHGTLNALQTQQLEGVKYVVVKKMCLDKVTKQGNVISISFKTMLDRNNQNIKKAHLHFSFTDGVAETIAENDFFCTISRYNKD